MITVMGALPAKAPREWVQSRSRQLAYPEEMKRFSLKLICYLIPGLLSALYASSASYAEERTVFFRENFHTLENWQPLTFPGTKKYTRYSVEKENGGSVLKAESEASASGIVHEDEFNVYEYPNVRWRWKVSNVYAQGNAERKSGDDAPLRVFILFKYSPATASFGTRMKYGLFKELYGDYPPYCSLSYIWGSRERAGRILSSPYARDSRTFVLRSGSSQAGTWQEEQINILEDHRKAFSYDPPATARIGIMNDSDNTGERSVSFIDYIEVFR